MGMTGEYLRLAPDELQAAIARPGWLADHAEQVRDAELVRAPASAQARHLSTEKAWHVIDYILGRARFPVQIVYGEEDLPGIGEDDWSYGPPSYLTPDRVRVAADALARTTFDDLVAGLEPADMAREERYPYVGDEPESLEWVRDCFEPLAPYFQAAAGAGEAIVVWIA
jgi:Domain of unknown function (DUF1877)